MDNLSNNRYFLGTNTGFAITRFPDPEDWVKVIAEDLELKYVQLTSELIRPDLPDATLNRLVQRTKTACQKRGLHIISTFTDACTRVNHLAHPDPDIRRHWISWFKRFADITADLGCDVMGSHPGIFSMNDNLDPKKRAERLQQNIDGWHEIAAYGKKRGLKHILWEPMSVKREQGETIAAAKELQRQLNEDAPLPFYMCLDVDHGDVSSPNPDDLDPYSWLTHFADVAPQIHIKQSGQNKHGHWPFTNEYNKDGKIVPEKVQSALESGLRQKSLPEKRDYYLIFELGFREREPYDSHVVDVLRQSVQYWQPHVSL